MALTISGGGPRALLGSVGCIDALAKNGLLDCLTHIIGLSGSAWFVAQWLARNDGTNPFFGTPEYWKCGHPPPKTQSTAPLNGLSFEGRSMLRELAPKLMASPIRPCSVIKEYANFLSSYLFDRNKDLNKWSEVQPKLMDGSYPLPICTAITEERSSDAKNRNWRTVDFSPFRVSDGISSISMEQFEQDNHQIQLAELTAIWGSAFAFDFERAEKGGFPSCLRGIMTIAQSSDGNRRAAALEALHIGDDWVWNGSRFDGGDGQQSYRDAGIDVNIAFQSAMRLNTDILLVLDASHNSDGCNQLKSAVARGYLQLNESEMKWLDEPFKPDETLRIFYPSGGPVIMYMLALTTTDTTTFDYDAEQATVIASCTAERVTKCVPHIKEAIKRRIKDNPKDSLLISTSTRLPDVRLQLKAFYKEKYKQIRTFVEEDHHSFEDLYTELTVHKFDPNQGYSPGHDIDAFDIWSEAEQQGLTRASIEGDAGSGKTTLCRRYAQGQQWEDKFACVVLVELNDLRNLQTFGIQEILTTSGVPQELHERIKANSHEVLWIWDGYDEVEEKILDPSQKRYNFYQFLVTIAEGNVVWAPRCLISSRHDKYRAFKRCACLSPTRWTSVQVQGYIDRFFQFCPNPKAKENMFHQKARQFFQNNINKPEPTPLLCELVCSVVDERFDVNSKESDVYKKVLQKYWQRFIEKPENQQVYGDALQDFVEAAERHLKEAALKITKQREAFELCVPNETKPSKENVLLRCGLLSCKRTTPGIYHCNFIHKTFCEFLTALQLSESPELFKDLKSILALAETQRKLVSFLSSLVAPAKTKWKILVKILVKKHSKLDDKNSSTVAQEFSARGKEFSTREKLRKDLGINICVEAVSILDRYPGNDATKKFMDSMITLGLPTLAKATPNSVLQKLVPYRYRLMVEAAARFGNLTMMKRLYTNIGVDQVEMDAAMVAAFISEYSNITDFLRLKGAKEVSLELCCRIGSEDAVKRALQTHPPTDDELIRAFTVTSLGEIWSALYHHNPKRCDKILSHPDTATFLSEAKALRVLNMCETPTLLVLMTNKKATRNQFEEIGSLTRIRALLLNRPASLPLTDDELQYFKYTPQLRDLRLADSGCITDDGLVHLSTHLPKLTNIMLSGASKITDRGISHLHTMTALTALHLGRSQISQTGLQDLSQILTRLTELDLSKSRSIVNLKYIRHKSRLTSLNLSACPILTLKYLDQLSNLKKLSLYQCKALPNTDFTRLGHLTSLTHLDVSRCQVSDASLPHISHLTSCRVSDAGLPHIGHLLSLNHLNLELCSISDDGLSHISHLMLLKVLNLGGCFDITDQGFAHLPHLTRLTDLRLQACHKISSCALQYICKYTQLTVLGLGNCDREQRSPSREFEAISHLTNLTVLNLQGWSSPQQIGKLTNLTELDLRGAGITDSNVQHIACHLTQLTTLNLSSCNSMSQETKATLPLKFTNVKNLSLDQN